MIGDQIRNITGGRACDYRMKRGWWCSRDRGHDGPCALRPVPWRFGLWWEYEGAYRRPTFNTTMEALRLPFRAGHVGRTLTGVMGPVHQRGRYAVWGNVAGRARYGRIGKWRFLLDYPRLRRLTGTDVQDKSL